MNQKPSDQGPTSSKSMWIGVAVVFGLMVCAWIAMFFFASKHQPADVRDQPVREAPAK
jgi:flagellar basal body-associated protein FliL